MGFFNEIKKLMFGVKSVSKSAADKVVDTGKKKGKEMADKAEDLFDEAKDKVEDMAADARDSAENLWDKAVDMAEDTGEIVREKSKPYIDDAKDFVEDVGGKVIEKSKPFVDDAKEFAEGVGEKVIDKTKNADQGAQEYSDDLREKGDHLKQDLYSESDNVSLDEVSVEDLFDTGDSGITSEAIEEGPDTEDTMAEDILDTASDLKSDLAEKAKNVSDKLSEKMDETLEKAKKLAEEEASRPEYSEPSELLQKDLLEDKDDFFAKASAFADGNYDAVRDPFSKKADIIGKSDEPKKTTENTEPIAGFEDLDGDGNEIIDDALIIEEEEE